MTWAGGEGLFLDLDGTLADNLSARYEAYLAFLAGSGREGSPEEFHRLDGRPLPEVLRCLVERHRLEESPESCEERYRLLVAGAWRDARARTGAAQLIRRARERGTVVAVLTSLPSALARAWLHRMGLLAWVDVLVGGERGGPGRPEPAPYLEALQRTGCGAERSLALEGTRSGAEAAVEAGLRTWMVGDVPVLLPPGVQGHLPSLEEALPLLRGVEPEVPASRVRSWPLGPEFRLEVGAPWRTPSALRERIEVLWREEEARQGRRLPNGRLYALAEPGPDRLLLRPARERAHLARLRDPSLVEAGLHLVVAGVAGVLVCREGVVLGRRGADGSWGPVPSGPLLQPDPRGQLLALVLQQAGLPETAVEEPRLCGVVEDSPAGLADLVFRVPCPLSAAEVEAARPAGGVEEVAVVAPAELPAFLEEQKGRLAPTLQASLELAGLPTGPG